jgi:hypothetical protein
LTLENTFRYRGDLFSLGQAYPPTVPTHESHSASPSLILFFVPSHPALLIRPCTCSAAANHALGPFLSFSPSAAQAPPSFSPSAAPSPCPFLLCARPSLPQGRCSRTRVLSRRRGRRHGVLQMGDPTVREQEVVVAPTTARGGNHLFDVRKNFLLLGRFFLTGVKRTRPLYPPTNPTRRSPP